MKGCRAPFVLSSRPPASCCDEHSSSFPIMRKQEIVAGSSAGCEAIKGGDSETLERHNLLGAEIALGSNAETTDAEVILQHVLIAEQSLEGGCDDKEPSRSQAADGHGAVGGASHSPNFQEETVAEIPLASEGECAEINLFSPGYGLPERIRAWWPAIDQQWKRYRFPAGVPRQLKPGRTYSLLRLILSVCTMSEIRILLNTGTSIEGTLGGFHVVTSPIQTSMQTFGQRSSFLTVGGTWKRGECVCSVSLYDAVVYIPARRNRVIRAAGSRVSQDRWLSARRRQRQWLAPSTEIPQNLKDATGRLPTFVQGGAKGIHCAPNRLPPTLCCDSLEQDCRDCESGVSRISAYSVVVGVSAIQAISPLARKTHAPTMRRLGTETGLTLFKSLSSFASPSSYRSGFPSSQRMDLKILRRIKSDIKSETIQKLSAKGSAEQT